MKRTISVLSFLLLLMCMKTDSFAQDFPAPKGSEQFAYPNPNFDGAGLTTVLPGNFSTSTLGRAPMGTRRFINSKYIVTGVEMLASGYSGAITSIGWRWNVPMPPAATAPVAQSVATTGNLRVYVKDTSASAEVLGSTFIDTLGASGYTKIIDGTISIPAGISEINIDVPVGGPGTSSFTPTPGNGVLVIFIYKTTDAALATPLNGAPITCCTNSGTGTRISTFTSTTTSGSAGTASVFRPETRFGFTQMNCDLAVFNLNPVGITAPGCDPVNVAPKAKIFNNGLLDQTGVSATYEVTSAGYDETVTGLTVTAGGNIEVTFPNTLVLDPNSPGVKNVTITVDGTCDGNPVSYVLNTSYEVSAFNPNFGGPVDNYYFANSTSGASCAPDQPIYYWEDTTGSTSLILDRINVTSPSILVGSVDDGFFTLGNIIGGNSFRYHGVAYDSFFVGTNGMIAFSRANNTQAQLTTFTPLAIPSITAPRPAIFPFWKDFNYGDIDVPVNRLSYKVSGNKLIITYDRAPNFNSATDVNDYVSFQVILELTSSFEGVADNDIIVQYDDGATGSSFLTKYNAATLATHTVGIMNLAGTSAIQYRRATPTVLVPGPLFSSPLALAFGPNDQVLPVELASFTSNVNGNNVDLAWTTSTETNNAGFDIERSSNGVWTRIANVTGNGTTSSPQSYTFSDRNLTSGIYNYRLKQIDFNGNFEYFSLSNEVVIGVPTKYELSQNYPNPFNPSTKINYSIPQDGLVSLKIFDMSGKEVATLVNEVKTAGYYDLSFNAANLPSGVYFYTLSAERFTETKKMLLVK